MLPGPARRARPGPDSRGGVVLPAPGEWCRHPASLPREVERGRAHLLREAQAMARVSHMVPVYDVGTFGPHVFLAMQLVEAQTLSEWLKAAPRPGSRCGPSSWTRPGPRGGARGGHGARDFKPESLQVTVGAWGSTPCVLGWPLRWAHRAGSEARPRSTASVVRIRWNGASPGGPGTGAQDGLAPRCAQVSPVGVRGNEPAESKMTQKICVTGRGGSAAKSHAPASQLFGKRTWSELGPRS